ncbi:uncharacterized protein LOC125759122 [Rhipicephalus sanguineus]|uniref:uncharacterized protein LOC125759122 n=1 Tax=Rhipicephalus sanguineus TaxID=34632 RepID=UPI0020C375FC|nr:uncharacterized protein LOC125759122 [Rhipicephalus sanguineus]
MYQVLPGILAAAAFTGGAATESTVQPWMAAMAHVQCAPPCRPLMRAGMPDTFLLELQTGHTAARRGTLPDPPYQADKREHLSSCRLGCGILLGTNLCCFMYHVLPGILGAAAFIGGAATESTVQPRMAAMAHVQCAPPCRPLMRAGMPDTFLLELQTGHTAARRGTLPDPPYQADKREHLSSCRLGCGTLLGTNLRCFMYQVLPGILAAAAFTGGAATESTVQPWMAAMAHVQCAPPCRPLMRAGMPDTFLLELQTGHTAARRGTLPDPPYQADKREHLSSCRLGCGTLLGTNLRCFMYHVLPGILGAAAFTGGAATESTVQPRMAAMAHVQCAPPCRPLMRAGMPDTFLLELQTGHTAARRGTLPDPPYQADKREHLSSCRLGCGTLLGTNLRCFMYQVLPGILAAAAFTGGAATESTVQPWVAAMAHVQCAPPCRPLMRAGMPDTFLLELQTGHTAARRGKLPDPPYQVLPGILAAAAFTGGAATKSTVQPWMAAMAHVQCAPPCRSLM